jgi:hypothetical protein
MRNTTAVIVGVAIGAAAVWTFNYIFGPAPGTRFDATYQSRLDRALAEGDRAAREHEAELRRQFEEAKRRRPSPPPLNPAP